MKTLLMSALVMLTAHGAFGQGTQADYDRAANLRRQSQNRVQELDFSVNWAADGSSLWWRGNDGWVQVNTSTGQRERLAAPPGAAVEMSLSAFAPSTEIRSSGSGDESAITFVNHTNEVVRTFWIDPQGKHHEYAQLKPNAVFAQHTFASHAWLITELDKTPIVMFVAKAQPARAVITGPGTEQFKSKRRTPRQSNLRSPNGEYTIFFRHHNAWLRNLATGDEQQLSQNGTEARAYGGRAWWSPDSLWVVILQTTPAQKHPVHIVESSPDKQLQPVHHVFNYLKPDDQIAHSYPCLFHVASGKSIEIDEALIEHPWSIAQIHWHLDSSQFSFLYNKRGHQTQRLISVNVETTEARVVVEETSQTFINYSNKTFLHHLDDSNELIWMSERSGWNHLYLIDNETGAATAITTGDWLVRGVDHVDAEKRQIWFRLMGYHADQDPYHIHFGRINFDGTDLTLLTEGDGTHEISYSPDRNFIVDTYSRVDLPPIRELRRASDGSLVCALSRANWDDLLETGWQTPERFVTKGRDDATDIWGVIFRPTTFNESRSYPIIESIYAGPHGQHVPKSFRTHFAEQQLAELGFVVVKIDGMGTNWRSKQFHDVCWKNIADAGFPDRVGWIRDAAATRPWMDVERVGIYGGSAGGQNAMRALIDHHDLYDVAVSDCGCHDNRMDKIWWNEAWMGWPVDDSYVRSSNVVDAHRLQGALLLTVGENDRNVDPASTMQVVDALIKADKDFDLIVFPGAGHGAGGSAYGRRRMYDFFVRHLLGVEPRS